MKLWPPLKGNYKTINPEGDLIVITRKPAGLHEHSLFEECRRIALIGPCLNDNVGIDKIILNTITNGKIRSMIICGEESKGLAVGDSLTKLVIEGVDENKSIIKATGDDPRLKTKRRMIERFREQVINVKTINSTDPAEIINKINETPVEDMLEDYPYDANKEAEELINEAIKTKGAKIKFKKDTKGRFIIELQFNKIVVRHRCKGKQDTVLIGDNAEELCNKVLELKLTSKADHSMYLGRELQRAEIALKNQETYVQDDEGIKETNYLKTIFIRAESLSEAWLKTMKKIYSEGEEYVVGKYADAKTNDLPVMIHIKNVKNQPLIHKAAPKANPIEKYAEELIEGKGTEKENEFNYTYYSRLKHRYDCELINNLPNIMQPEELEKAKTNCKNCKLIVINQVEEAIKVLKTDPTVKRVQLITWMPYKDLNLKNSINAPCMVLIQPRVNRGKLDFFVFFRSQDLYNAFPSNSYAIFKLQEHMADRLGLKTGAYTQFTSSMHIYNNSMDNVEELLRQERLI